MMEISAGRSQFKVLCLPKEDFPLCNCLYTLSQGQLAVQEQAEKDTPTSLPFKIPVRLEDKVILVNPAEVLYVEAEMGVPACIPATPNCRLTSPSTSWKSAYRAAASSALTGRIW